MAETAVTGPPSSHCLSLCPPQVREQNRAAAAEAQARKERQRKAAEEKRRVADARRKVGLLLHLGRVHERHAGFVCFKRNLQSKIRYCFARLRFVSQE